MAELCDVFVVAVVVAVIAGFASRSLIKGVSSAVGSLHSRINENKGNYQ